MSIIGATCAALLLSRSWPGGVPEIDLWPSQLHVVDRIFQDMRDLVVALPTSAGKTRIAELSILACLAQMRRTVYVTPLRALSAQTEQVLARTFSPLGVRVSSLYGSVGVSDVDEDALRSSEIVVATPEKLDFALRADPSVLNNVGLVVLDEGHMIGASEREVRYEAPDSATATPPRRLGAPHPLSLCRVSFPGTISTTSSHGSPTTSLTGFIEKSGALRGNVSVWSSGAATMPRLTITVGPDQPFIPRYFESRQPTSQAEENVPGGPA